MSKKFNKIVNNFLKEDKDVSKQERIDALKKLGSGPPPITVLPSRKSVYSLFVNLANTRPNDLLSVNQAFSMAHNEHEEDLYLLADLMVDYYDDIPETKKWEVIKYLTHKIPSNFLLKLLRESSKEDRIKALKHLGSRKMFTVTKEPWPENTLMTTLGGVTTTPKKMTEVFGAPLIVKTGKRHPNHEKIAVWSIEFQDNLVCYISNGWWHILELEQEDMFYIWTKARANQLSVDLVSRIANLLKTSNYEHF